MNFWPCLLSAVILLVPASPSCYASSEPRFVPEPKADPATRSTGIAIAQPAVQRRLHLGPLQSAPSPQEADLSKGRLQIGTRRVFPETARINNSTQGEWVSMPDASRLWAAQIQADGSKGLRLHVANIRLPKSATLLVYSPGSSAPASIVNASEIDEVGEIWMPTVFGQQLIFECRVPQSAALEEVSFELDQVSHLYSLPYQASPAINPCNHDATCYSNWAREASAIGKISFVELGASYLCSGAAIAGADPVAAANLFLTANHCISNQKVAATLEVYWFYQNSTCGGTPADILPVNITTGSDFLAGSSVSDFTLLRLRASPPPGVYYLQWSTALPLPDEPLTVIHHSGGEVKQISFGTRYDLDPSFTFVRWSSGVTEEGASGSPLLNAQRQIIGQLYGGYSSCADPTAPDMFGRFDVSYPSLKRFLDGESSTNLSTVSIIRGNYYGLFQMDAQASAASSGLIGITVGSGNLFTGNIRMLSGIYPFSGRFDKGGISVFSVPRGRLSDLTVSLKMDGVHTNLLSGSVYVDQDSGSVNLKRNVYGLAHRAPQAGRYTIALSDATSGTCAGFALCTVSATGSVQLSAKMPGVGAWSRAGYLTDEGQFPLFIPLTGNLQLLSGWTLFGAGNWSASGGNWMWWKSIGQSALEVAASRYVSPSLKSAVLGAPVTYASFTGGPLDSTFTFNSGTKRLVTATSGSHKVLMSFATNGTFSGTISGSPSGSFRGVVLQNSQAGLGYTLWDSGQGTVRLSTNAPALIGL